MCLYIVMYQESLGFFQTHTAICQLSQGKGKGRVFKGSYSFEGLDTRAQRRWSKAAEDSMTIFESLGLYERTLNLEQTVLS